MAILEGRDSFIGFREITGTAQSPNTVPAEFIFIDSYDFKREKEEQIQEQELGLGVRTPRRRVTGNINCTGTFTRNLDPNNGIALYEYLMTGSVTSTNVAAGDTVLKQHYFFEGERLTSITTLQFTTYAGGDSATALDWFNGIVESYSLNATVNSPVKETWNLKFADHGSTAANTLPTVALTQTDPINFNKAFVRFGATITTVSQAAVQEITLNVNNQPTENREIGTNTLNQHLYGIKQIDGSMNMTFQDLSHYNNFINETAVAMSLLLESVDSTSGTSHSVEHQMPRVFFNGETPSVNDQGEIVLPINFSAIYGSNAGYMHRIIVNNQDATPTK